MEVLQYFQKALISLGIVALIALFWRLYNALVIQPGKLRSIMRKQGITGPPPTLLFGNILEIKKAWSGTANAPPIFGVPNKHDCATTIFPFFQNWLKKYGDMFMLSMGNTQVLVVTRQEIVKEMTTCTSPNFGKPSYQAKEHSAFLGDSIFTSNGTQWAHQRKVIAPELFMDKVKGMTKLIQESAMTIVNSWNKVIEEKGGIADIKVDPYMRRMSGDVISKACFGSSYNKGEDLFSKLTSLEEATSKKFLAIGIPGMRHLPTKSNRKAWALAKEIKELILNVVKERTKAGYEKDLLQMVMETARNEEFIRSHEELDRFIVDNCKTIYFAGYESTAISAAWCLMLLAANPEWQERVRSEVVDTCRGRVPDAESIRTMKSLTMVINESLRLYPPATIMSREVFEDMKFGDIVIPKGVNVWAFVLTLHTDPEIWGNDSYEFNPQRFADGVAKACKYPQAYMPFGMGPRICLGQHLATVELKILIALIILRFSFTLSPTYIHSPVLRYIIVPKHGVNLCFKKL
ncbi:OLC1v1001610C1 [Oldenlandia corymbosa var. corymbosa]|uniref:OLC1v1001610C1 n=1 Tax=Oldenlandia corymbosa var. corymbosa TaxID=529605 RepID=A0AAV1D869_OLDCO|nr:OLC1v1001610C1 [Oldenlandia corymbosa var. corymbosa]